jgi:hypothetical protein
MAQANRTRYEEALARIRKERFARMRTLADQLQFEHDFGSSKPPSKSEKKEATNGRRLTN